MYFYSCPCSQQAYNAAVAINHMKKLQLAHTETILRQATIPDIKVTDVSSPTQQRKQPDKPELKTAEANGNSMVLPVHPPDAKSAYHSLKASQSQTHHVPTIADQGKNAFYSEPSNLNGFVPISTGVWLIPPTGQSGDGTSLFQIC